MSLFLWIELLVFWAAWFYPFVFRAPHGQKRQSITSRGPTLLGLLLEVTAIGLAFAFRLPSNIPRSALRLFAAAISGPLAVLLSWTAVLHLGRQFRVTAGLYHDHQLVTSGPYSIVRHPIYTSLLAILIATQSILTPLPWAAASLVLFIAGTEIRVRTEDKLLASRFGQQFEQYRKGVPAYLPFFRKGFGG
jgi:protein-S-isoprenylcysteine O-methyltransferase Ste14